MTNIFLFRHGNCPNSDYDSEKLSSRGIEQAEKAGIIVSEIINNLYLQLNGSPNLKELSGVLKAHSGRPRTSTFLGIMSKVVEDAYKFGNFGLYGDLISIISPKIYNDLASKKIRQVIDQCSSIAGIQFIVGHTPGVPGVIENYVSDGFNFQGDKKFLNATSEGGGYYINTLEKTVQSINQ